MFKYSMLMAVWFFCVTDLATGQSREDWPKGDGSGGGVVILRVDKLPIINWDYVLYESTWKTKVDELGPLSLSEKQKKELAWIKFDLRKDYDAKVHAASRVEEFFDEYSKASPERRKQLAETRKSVFDGTVEMDFDLLRDSSRLVLEKSDDVLTTDQKDKARQFVVGRLMTAVPMEQLFGTAIREKTISLSDDKKKEFVQKIRKINADLEQEIAKLQIQAWDRVVASLPDEQRKALEESLVLVPYDNE